MSNADPDLTPEHVADLRAALGQPPAPAVRARRLHLVTERGSEQRSLPSSARSRGERSKASPCE